MSLISERPDAARGWPALFSLLPALGLVFGGLDSTAGDVIVGLVAGLLLAALALTRTPPVRLWRRAWPALAPIGAALLWAAACSLRGDPMGIGARPIAPDLGAPALIGALGGAAALLAGLLVGARRVALARIIDWLLLFGCAGLVLALATQGESDAWEPWRASETGRFFGTLNNANVAGAVYAAFAALAVSRVLTDGAALWRDARPLGERARAAGHWVALLLAAGGCVLTASRSGVVLGLLALAVLGVRARLARLRKPVLLGLVAALAALGLGYAALLLQRFGGLSQDLDVRLLLWRHHAAVARQALWRGYGLRGFPTVNARFLGNPREAQAIWMTNSPHDIALKLVIDAGLPYLLLLAAAGAVIAAQVARAARARPLDLHETALLAAVGVIAGSSMIDLALEVPAVAALALSWVGVIWGRAIGTR